MIHWKNVSRFIDPAVKFEPAISSLQSVTSTFAETSPGTGIYEDAYDIWLNGIADSGSTEVMIWTENHGQVPSGSVQGTVTIDWTAADTAVAGAQRSWRIAVERGWRRPTTLPFDWTFDDWAPTTLATGTAS